MNREWLMTSEGAPLHGIVQCRSVYSVVIPAGVTTERTERTESMDGYYGTNAFGIGRSLVIPNCCISVPAVERLLYHVALDGRNTVGSCLPSPS